MMEINSALVILLAEGMAAMLLIGGGVFWFHRRKRGREISEIDKFVSHIAEREAIKSRMLEGILTERCGIESEKITELLVEVSLVERAVLQKVLEMFLQRDPALLPEIEQLITDLSDPYCKLMSDLTTVSKPADNNKPGDKKISGLERINQQLVSQLDTAMQTIDEITAEYTRVFSGNQTALELENSSKKMLQIFQDAEADIKKNLGANG